jgi:membrane fusion protein (multidrug efflux system)
MKTTQSDEGMTTSATALADRDTHTPEPTMARGNGEIDTQAPPTVNRPKSIVRVATALIAVVLAVAAAVWYSRSIAPFESTDNAAIEGHVMPIAPQVPGRIVRLLVQDNQEIRHGDVLLEIDPRDYEVKLAKAQANLAAARSRLEQAKAQIAVDESKIAQEKAGVSAIQAEESRAKADLKRYQAVESRAISRSQLDLAETQAQAALAQVEVSRNKALAAEAQLGLTKASLQTAGADVQQCEAAVREAELNLSYTKVTAPEAGRVTRRNAEPGAFVQPGQLLMAIVPRDFWVVANFKETQLTRMRVGQPVEIKVDTFPGRKFTGRIESFQSGAGARFSMFPPENASGNFIKVVQRVPVKILLDSGFDSQLFLGPGMSVVAKVRVQ